jgi:hypothetical protein
MNQNNRRRVENDMLQAVNNAKPLEGSQRPMTSKRQALPIYLTTFLRIHALGSLSKPLDPIIAQSTPELTPENRSILPSSPAYSLLNEQAELTEAPAPEVQATE